MAWSSVSFHSMVISEDGQICGWGKGAEGQFGEICLDRISPTIVPLKARVIKVATGAYHCIALTENGEIYVWGDNNYGQLGLERSVSKCNTPQKLSFPLPVVGLVTSQYSTMLLTEDGDIYSFGYSGSGHLGHGNVVSETYFPKKINAISEIVALGCGSVHSLALSKSGKVYSWGYGSYGQLGHGSFDSISIPTEIKFFSELKPSIDVIALSGGEGHSMALTATGEVYSWGRGGRLGYACVENQTVPKKVPGLSRVIALASGGRHNLALTEMGTVYIWGLNDNNQLGHLQKDKHFVFPSEIPGLKNVVAISCGSRHSLALINDGSIIAWGANDHGQCGYGRGKSSTPDIVIGISEQLPGFVPMKFAGNMLCSDKGIILRELHTRWKIYRLLWISMSDRNTIFSELPPELILVIQEKMLFLGESDNLVGNFGNGISSAANQGIPEHVIASWKHKKGFWTESELAKASSKNPPPPAEAVLSESPAPQSSSFPYFPDFFEFYPTVSVSRDGRRKSLGSSGLFSRQSATSTRNVVTTTTTASTTPGTTTLTGTTTIPASGLDLHSTMSSTSTLSSANLSSANLSSTNLSSTNLSSSSTLSPFSSSTQSTLSPTQSPLSPTQSPLSPTQSTSSPLSSFSTSSNSHSPFSSTSHSSFSSTERSEEEKGNGMDTTNGTSMTSTSIFSETFSATTHTTTSTTTSTTTTTHNRN